MDAGNERRGETALSGPQGLLVMPDGEPRCAVLVLAGSSGHIETDRARLLAAHGAAALSLRWFGDDGQPPGICEVPLETFAPAVDRLAGISDHLAVLGVSKGAEAALLLAVRDPRIRAVCGLAPTPVVWQNVGPGVDGPPVGGGSCWTADGTPLPFVRYDGTWTPALVDGLPAYRTLYEQSLETFAEDIEAATIPVERIHGDVLLAAGGGDLLWPSDTFAAMIAQRRAAHGLATQVVLHPSAGHRLRLPGEPALPARGQAMARGGTSQTESELGRQLWPALRTLLHLTER